MINENIELEDITDNNLDNQYPNLLDIFVDWYKKGKFTRKRLIRTNLILYFYLHYYSVPIAKSLTLKEIKEGYDRYFKNHKIKEEELNKELYYLSTNTDIYIDTEEFNNETKFFPRAPLLTEAESLIDIMITEFNKLNKNNQILEPLYKEGYYYTTNAKFPKELHTSGQIN